MASRFKNLSSNNEDSKRENIFKSKDNNTNNTRVVTGKSLKELISHPKSQEKLSKTRTDNFNNRTKGRYQNEKKIFSKTTPVIKQEFKVKNEEFPDLVEGKKQEETVKTLDYREKVQMVKEAAMKDKNILPQGWVFLSKKDTTVKKERNIEIISEYFNPKIAREILDNRLLQREELNDILGDISPYWNMMYPDEVDDEYYEYESDNYDDQEYEEYVEDW